MVCNLDVGGYKLLVGSIAGVIFIRYNINSAATRGEALHDVAVATYLFRDG